MMSQPVLDVSNLTKFYGNFKALDSVSFSVSQGWVYGYLGPNGAGKTTTIRTMLGLLKPNGGEVKITGVNPSKDQCKLFKRLDTLQNCPTYRLSLVERIC
jgi:ABC-type multidrug transport system ATPase subunit